VLYLVLIVEKTKMIGILKALGIKNFSLRKIFHFSWWFTFVSWVFSIGNSLAGIFIINAKPI
jgi:ABC-type lipoprotein release transport system permease subunit